MVRGSLLIGALFFAPFAAADHDYGTTCTFEEFSFTSYITADIAAARIGDVVGRFEARAVVPTLCGIGSYSAAVYLPAQPRISPSVCLTTVPGINMQANFCSNSQPGRLVGPSVFFLPNNGGARYPYTFVQTFNYIKSAQVPPGVYNLAPQQLAPLSVRRVHPLNGGYSFYNFTAQVTTGPVEIIGTTCSLVSSNVVVDFGEFSDESVSKDFQIAFDSCTSGADALAYNQAVSFKFVSERIRPDGSALLNGTCASCAKGIQVELQDGTGRDINLAQPFKLASNGAVEIRPNGLVHNFRANIRNNPDQPRSPGLLDTQLTFETVIE